MRKKLFTFLLALVTSVGLSYAAVDGKLPGAFTVDGSGNQVYFSQGNLQATTADNGSTWTWGFAEHQYDFIGDAVANNAINGGGTVSSNGAVDLFGWSSDDNNYFGIDNSTNLTDYDGNFQDWGTKMGSDWRTLTYDEWNYLLNTRVPGSLAGGTSNPRFARAQIFTDGTAPSKDIYGLILFPNDFNDGGYIDGVTWNGINSYDENVSPTYCTTAGWATLESMGCVFLPASGYRSDGAVTNVGAFGIYWASTKSTETDEDASCMYFFSNNVAVFRSYFKTGASVRLVSETAPGGSTPATGLQVVEVTSDIYDGWNSNGNTFSVNALPGFQAVTFDEAKEWTGVPTSGTAVLVYRTNGDYARVIHFFDGTISGDYDLETDFNQIYENITLFGNRIFYTAGGSTPTPTTSGSCGANVTWEFNPSTGALTITGTGAMDDYLNNASTPWNSYITDITSVTITDGVTNVGNHSFEQCTSLTTVTIGDDVETIGVFAFSECGEQFTTLTLGNSIRTIGNQAFASNYGITGFTLPSTLETIGNFAFIHNKAITTLTIPSNVTSIDKDAFYGCTAVTDVYCYPNAADLTWNEVDCDDFKSGKATICHVNSDQLDAYQTKFNDVVRVTFVGDLDAPTPASPVTAARFLYNYDCQRNPPYPQAGSPCNLSGFKDPYEGYKGSRNGNIALGPWKLEFVAYYTPSNNYDCASQVNSAVNEYYMGMSSEEKEAKKLEVPIFRLLQYNLTAREFQHATYGIVCAYAGEANAQDHAALFISSNDYGCFLSGHQHTTSFALTCENDLTTGLAALVDAASAPSDPYYDVVWPVIVSIDAIGPVELSEHCKYYIEGSRAAYDALTDEQKTQVTNYSTLTDAETQWTALAAAAQPYADAVIALINAIPNPVVYTQDCKDKIDAAQAAYDALTDGQKILVSNYETLKNAPSDLINAAPYVHILFKANNQERKVENVTLPKEFTDAEMKAMLKELYGVEGDYDMYAYDNSNADAVNISYEEWTISPFMGKVNVHGNLEKWDPDYEWFEFSLEISLELPPFAPTPTPTEEQVPTNADPENPTYHYSTFFHSTQNYKLFNDGTQAFIADLSNNELVLTEIAHGEQVIPANTAVILRKTGSADPVVLVPTAENGVSVNPDDNSLEGVDVATPIADKGMTQDNCYVLSGTNEHGVGFYKINGNTLKAHKAYVKYAGSSSNAPKKMRFVYGQATGIEDVQGNNVQSTKVIENGVLYIIRDGKTYNAMGQMVK